MVNNRNNTDKTYSELLLFPKINSLEISETRFLIDVFSLINLYGLEGIFFKAFNYFIFIFFDFPVPIIITKSKLICLELCDD